MAMKILEKGQQIGSPRGMDLALGDRSVVGGISKKFYENMTGGTRNWSHLWVEFDPKKETGDAWTVASIEPTQPFANLHVVFDFAGRASWHQRVERKYLSSAE